MTKCPACGQELSSDKYVRCPNCDSDIDPNVTPREAARDRDIASIAQTLRAWFHFQVFVFIVIMAGLLWLYFDSRSFYNPPMSVEQRNETPGSGWGWSD